jgi:hypothetical protein
MLLLLLALFLLKGRPAIGLGSLLASNRGVVGDQLVVIIGREAIIIDLLGLLPLRLPDLPLDALHVDVGPHVAPSVFQFRVAPHKLPLGAVIVQSHFRLPSVIS